MTSERIRQLAAECGFDIAGVTPALPAADFHAYREWVDAGMAGGMGYLTDHRADVREDPRRLLPSARSIICAGKLYNRPEPRSTETADPERGWISRYAWGRDYHDVLRDGLEQLAARLRQEQEFEYRICVDTAPLLERSYARLAGLGWIGKNTCLINQQLGSYLFLGELLVSLALEPDAPPPDRCGTCTRCIDACPTDAIIAPGVLDSRVCIPYFTIELRGEVPAGPRAGIGNHIFGCDICQDVCPWNKRAPFTADPAFAPGAFAPPLEELASLTEHQFHQRFRGSPVTRAKYSGFLRNVALAMGNARLEKFREPLERLAASSDPVVAEAASWALAQFTR